MDRTPSHERRLSTGLRDTAALVLVLTSGATDAVSFLGLGGAFTSVMTGNLVLLGISLGHNDASLGGRVAVALICFIAGTVLGARLVGSATDDRVWPPGIAAAFGVELGTFVVYAALWWAGHGRPAGTSQVCLLGISAIALGIQSAAVRRFGVSGLATTYLTSTLITLVVRLAAGHGFREVARHLLMLIGLVCGAALGAVLAHGAPTFVPLVQLLPMGIAFTIASWQTRPSKQAGPHGP